MLENELFEKVDVIPDDLMLSDKTKEICKYLKEMKKDETAIFKWKKVYKNAKNASSTLRDLVRRYDMPIKIKQRKEIIYIVKFGD